MMDFTPAPHADFAAKFEALIDKAIKDKKEADDAEYKASAPDAMRPAIGAGRLGNECLRAIAYEYHRVPKEREITGRLYRIFDRGHMMEDKMAEYLRLAGFTLLTVSAKTGKQFRYDVAKYEDGKGRIKGMIDGVITAAPEGFDLPCPANWENKELGNKSWSKLAKSGLKRYGGDYYPQVQMGMAYMELTHTLFTAKNADTQEIYAEVVPLDAAEAQRISDRGSQVIATRFPEEMPRVSNDPCNFKCKFCDYTQRCHGQVEAPQSTAPTGWCGAAS